MAEWITLGCALALLVVVLVWVYRKRNRLFFQTRFVAETTMMNYQDESKRAAMEEVAYLNEEEQEDEAGEKKE